MLPPSIFKYFSSRPSVAIVLTLSVLRDKVNLPFSAAVVIPESAPPTTLRPSLSFTSPFEELSPFISNFEAPTASVTLVVKSLFVITLVSTKFLSPNVYFLLSPALIVKVPLSSVVIELMFLRSFDKPTTILPLVSIFVIMFLPLSKLDHSVFAASPLIEICVPSFAVYSSPLLALNFRPLSVEFLISVKASFKTFLPVPPQPLAGASMYGSAEPSVTLSFLSSPPKISFKRSLYFLS